LFVDADLGFFSDDYVGTAPEARMTFTYNGNDFDRGSAGYGEQPPAIGIVAGPPSGDAVTRGSVVFKNGNVLGVWNTESAEAMLRGLQSDASGPWRYGDVGNAPGAPPTDWTFPVLPPGFWSEANLDGQGTRNTPADRRMMISQGPYTLTDGETLVFEIAIPWARAESGGALGSARLLTAILGPLAAALPVAAPEDIATIGLDDVRVGGDGGEPPPPRGDPTSFGLAPTPEPNPVRAGSVIRYSAPGPGPLRLAVYDALGREVAVPLNGPAAVGYHRLPLDASGLAPGAYTYRMTIDGRRHPTVGRFVVVR
ncbi:MAG: T9SS type A sorting domain-containing protein, partial [Bacteroidota bacterium]